VKGASGEVRGTATLVRRAHPLARHIAGIEGVVVDYRYWRRGIARGLFAQLASHAATMGIELLATSCRASTAAETVYRRLGIAEYGRLLWSTLTWRGFDGAHVTHVTSPGGQTVRALRGRYARADAGRD